MSKKAEGSKSITSSDVPGGKQTKEQTAELESLYRDMVELSPDGVVTTDAKGVIKSCNAAITRMLGYSSDYLVGRHFTKLGAIRLKDIPKYLKLFKDILGGEGR